MMSKAASRSTIAVLPKPGKLLASSTSSSILSMSTSTSISNNLSFAFNRHILPPTRPGINLAHGLQYAVRHEPAHVAAQRGYLPHDARREKAVLRGGHDEHRFELRVHLPVELGLLELRLEIGDGPEPLDYHPRPLLPGEVDEESVHYLDRDVVELPGDLLDEPRTLGGLQARFLAQVAAHGHHDVVEDPRSPPDDVQVPRGHGIETPGADRHDHCEFEPIKYGYERAPVAARYPFLARRAVRRSLAALDHHPASGCEQSAQPGNQAHDLRGRDSIWRISEYQIEYSPVCKHQIQDSFDIAPHDLRSIGYPRPPEVLPDRRDGTAVLLDEHGALASTAQRFYPQSAGPRVEVQDVAAVEELPQRVEHALAHAVGGRAHPCGHRGEPRPPRRTRDHPQYFTPGRAIRRPRRAALVPRAAAAGGRVS